MSIKLTKRIAAIVMDRGESSIRINPTALAEAKKAITREDVRVLIKNGSVYAIKEKKNLSLHGKELKKKRIAGRKRGYDKEKFNVEKIEELYMRPLTYYISNVSFPLRSSIYLLDLQAQGR